MFENEKNENLLKFYCESMLDLISKHGGDNEVLHYMADDLLIEFLLKSGYEDLVNAYDKVRDCGFWYA